MGPGGDEGEHATGEGEEEYEQTDHAPAALRGGTDGQAPGNGGGPESIGQVIAGAENEEWINDVGDKSICGDGADGCFGRVWDGSNVRGLDAPKTPLMERT